MIFTVNIINQVRHVIMCVYYYYLLLYYQHRYYVMQSHSQMPCL